MIKNKEDLTYYLESDRLSLGRNRRYPKIHGDYIWKYQILLRKWEYYSNVKSPTSNILSKIYGHRVFVLGIRLGFSIPKNVFGPGLSIAHVGTIVINGASKIGKNCRIHTCVNIGTEAGTSNKAPVFGDNLYIGPGAKIFGKIEIGDNVAIGANSVVNKSFKEGNYTIGGAPAKVISQKSSDGLVIKGADIYGKSKKTS